ncbi:hypothetical protein [Aeoliella sp.]|uniref:hypothetical protein n=1 Tax=Aeoliella sp. TaxID=2795800 RepID=UPI003CCBDAF4
MPSFRLITQPDPFDPAGTRYLVCRPADGSLVVLSNHATHDAARQWMASRVQPTPPAAPHVLAHCLRAKQSTSRARAMALSLA